MIDFFIDIVSSFSHNQFFVYTLMTFFFLCIIALIKRIIID